MNEKDEPHIPTIKSVAIIIALLGQIPSKMLDHKMIKDKEQRLID